MYVATDTKYEIIQIINYILVKYMILRLMPNFSKGNITDKNVAKFAEIYLINAYGIFACKCTECTLSISYSFLMRQQT